MAGNKKKEVVAEDAQGTPAAATLSTKSAVMSGVLQAISSMSHEDMMKWFPDAMALAAGVGNFAGQNAQSIAMKGSPIKEDVATLFEGEELNEEALDKISTLIESAVALQVTMLTEQLEEQYQTKLIEEAVKLQETMVEKIDSYATYAAEQWIEKNQVAVESTIKLRRADKILEGLTELVKAAGIKIEEEQVSVVESLEAEIDELKGRLNESLNEAVAIREKLVAQTALGIFDDVSEGLTEIEKDKLKKLVEDIDVDIDPTDLEKKLRIIREAHFKAGKETSTAAAALVESLTVSQPETVTVDESGNVLTETIEVKPLDPLIERYSQAISRGTNRYRGGKTV
jgi:hypothetical protein